MKLSRNRYKNRELIQSSATDDHISIRILVREFDAAAVTFESWQGWQDISDFDESVEGQILRKLLMVAIDGKGAFRRFNNVLYDYPETREQWFAFKEARMRKQVLE